MTISLHELTPSQYSLLLRLRREKARHYDKVDAGFLLGEGLAEVDANGRLQITAAGLELGRLMRAA